MAIVHSAEKPNSKKTFKGPQIKFWKDYTLNNSKLSLEPNRLFTHIKNSYPRLKVEYSRLELNNSTLKVNQDEEKQVLENISNEIRSVIYNIRTEIQELNSYIYIPELAPVA